MDVQPPRENVRPMWSFTCTDCGEQFELSDVIVRSKVRMVLCPCCGCTDLDAMPPQIRLDAA